MAAAVFPGMTANMVANSGVYYNVGLADASNSLLLIATDHSGST